MLKSRCSKVAITACALMLAIPLTAANKPAATKSNNATVRVSKATVWKAETLSGKVMEVDPNQHLVVIETAGGVPFDMVVSAKTIIKAGDQRLTLKELTPDVNRPVQVTFKPERRGDVATAIHING